MGFLLVKFVAIVIPPSFFTIRQNNNQVVLLFTLCVFTNPDIEKSQLPLIYLLLSTVQISNANNDKENESNLTLRGADF